MNRHTVIIAEAGVNHNGSLEQAKELVRKAAESKVDYIKFQTFHAEKCVSRFAEKAQYQQKNTGNKNESQLEMVKKLELSESDHLILVDYCNSLGIRFFSTAFDLDSLDFLASLNLGLWKIPSGEITNYPFLVKIAKYNEPTILSTGMCNLSDIEAAVNVLTQNGLEKNKITILHCNTEYPTPFEDVNLLAMNHIKRAFGVNVGYSDHTKGIEIPIAAVALGATIIEKHFTLDRNLPGPDHKASLEPHELKSMVSAIRNIEIALGDGHKQVSASEAKNVLIARKSIVASRFIHKGDVFSDNNITVKRPGTGISPMKWPDVIGRFAIRDFQEDELIEL